MLALISLLTSLLVLFCYTGFYLSQRKFKYWKIKNVPYLKPLPLFGNYKDYILLKTFHPEITQKLCQQFPDEPYIGAFFGTEPTIILKDPELIKLVLTKDFYYFHSREIANYSHSEINNQNLFFNYGDKWRVMRQNITPILSVTNIRNMFPLIEKCTTSLDSWLTEEISESNTINAKTIMDGYTIACISSCFFGIEVNSMGRKAEINLFKIIGNHIFEPSTILGLKMVGRSIWPKIFYGLGFKFINENVTDFFYKLLTDVFANRQNTSNRRHDFVELILSLRNNKYVTGDCISNLITGDDKRTSLEVTNDFLVANCLVMFAAGYETSSNTLGFVLYELAKNKGTQENAIEEVDKYCVNHKKIDYECTHKLPYLDACIDETLRLYPVLGVNTREVMEDYTLPTGVTLDRGVRVHIPTYYLQRNPDYFPEPEQYRPERFYGETKEHIESYTYMPFGQGHRICIGMKFAKMQMIAGLVTILRKYRVELAEGMPSTLQFDPRSFTTQSKKPILLKFIPRCK